MKQGNVRLIYLLFPFLFLTCESFSDAYELRTHAEITNRAFERSKGTGSYLQAIGIKRSDVFDYNSRTFPDLLADFDNSGTPRDWMIEGSIREDDFLSHSTCPQPENPPTSIDRPVNHFFDVQRGGGGLSNLLVSGYPAPDWALGQQGRSENQFTILDARQYQLKSLTETNKQERERNTALLFRTLGHVIHLVQDMAQPQHTRNDAHSGCFGGLFGAGEHSWYEEYIEKLVRGQRYRERSNPPGPLVFTAYDPPGFLKYREFWANAQQTGLADFSSRNFFSTDTNLSKNDCGGLFHPECNSSAYQPELTPFTYRTVDGRTISGEVTLYTGGVTDQLSGTTYTGVALSSRSVWDQHLESFSPGLPPSFTLNTINYDHMSALLLTRARGYSEGLLDYFFRGRLDLSLVQDDTDPTIVRLEGKNDSSERLDGGTLELYGDDSQGIRTAATPVSSTTVTADPGQPISVRYRLPNNSEKFIAVYKGKLGEEAPNGEFPGAVIGKVVEGVQVEQLFRDSTRWYIRNSEGVYPTEILAQDVQDLQWGDNDNTLVGRSRIGPGRPNMFYSYLLNRPLGATNVPLRLITTPLPDQPTATQIVDMQVQQQVPFPFGIHVGTDIQATLAIDYEQYLISWVRTEFGIWNEEHTIYNFGGYAYSSGAVDRVLSDSQSISRTYPVVLNPDHFGFVGRPYGAFTTEIGLTPDGRILAVIQIGLSDPEEIATFPAKTWSANAGATGSTPPTLIDDTPITVRYQFPVRADIGQALWVVLDVTNSTVVASTAPAILSLTYRVNYTSGSRITIDNPQGVQFGKTRYSGGPRDGEFIWGGLSVAPVGNVTFKVFGSQCQNDQPEQLVVLGQVSARHGKADLSLDRYKADLAQFPGVSSADVIVAQGGFPFACSDPKFGVPPTGFNVTVGGKQIFANQISQMSRTSPGSNPEQLVLNTFLGLAGTPTIHYRFVRWTPETQTAELREEFVGRDDYTLIGATPSNALVQSFIFENFDSRGPKILVALDGTTPNLVMTGVEENDFYLLNPDYLYDADNLKFYTKESTPRQTSLPKSLASAPTGNPEGRYHLLRIRGLVN